MLYMMLGVVAAVAAEPGRGALRVDEVYRAEDTIQEEYARRAEALRLEAIARLEALLAAELERERARAQGNEKQPQPRSGRPSAVSEHADVVTQR